MIARLHDGLGNQMFQYAAARSVSLKRRLTLKLDLFHYESQELRRYGLGPFRIQAGLAQPEESPIRFLPSHRRPPAGFAAKALRRLFPKDPVPVYSEKEWWKYEPGIFAGSGAVYLNGYWQTEKYFQDIAGTIREDFRLKAPLSGQAGDRARGMERENSVAVHVRRRDLVEKGITLTPDYYVRAFELLRGKETGIKFYFFSDDPDWVRTHLFQLASGPKEMLEGGAGHEEMMLMSRCRHHVISNSTFAWWAAWLCEHPAKIVVAPKVWWRGKKAPEDLIPPAWTRL